MNLNKTVVFKVNGIHCNGCANKIKNSIEQLKIKQTTEVDVSSGEVKVQFNSDETNASELKSKILEAGYQIESLSLE